MTGGLATHMTANDHYIFIRLWRNRSLGPGRRRAHALRKRDKICEILAPCVFHAVGQHDNAFRRKRFNRTFIMSNKHYRAAEPAQRAKYLFPAGWVKVVCRLVEQQHVGA